MHARLGRDDELRRRPVERQAAIRGCRRLLAHLVVGRHVLAGIRIEHRLGAGIRAHHLARDVYNFQLHFTLGVVRQVVVHKRARRRALAGRQFGWPRRGFIDAGADAHRRCRLEQVRLVLRQRRLGRCRLSQRRHVVQYPEAATVRAGNQIRAPALVVVFDLQIAHRNRRHVVPQRLPVIAIVKRHPHLRVGAGVEQSGLPGIFADGIGDGAARDAGVDLGPGLAAIVRAIEVRRDLVEAQRVGRRIGDQRIEVAGLDVKNACPRLDRRRRDVGPRDARIPRDLDVAIVRARPQNGERARTGAKRGDAAHGRRLHAGAVLAGVGRYGPRRAREIRRDAGPRMTVVDARPHHVRAVIQGQAVYRREVQRHGAHVAVHGAATGQRARGVWTHLRGLRGAAIVTGHAVALAAIDDIRVPGVRRGHAVFLDVHGMPVVERDASVIRAALHARATGILLPGTDAIGKRVVSGHVVHRGGVLVVPVAPAQAAIRRDHGALVGHRDDDLRIVRVDPDALVVVAARRAAHGAPRQPAVHGPPHHGRGAVDDVRVFGVDGDGREIAAADAGERAHVLRQSRRCARSTNGLEPVGATVSGLVETNRALSWCDHGVEDVRIARGDRHVGLLDRRQALRQLVPGGAAVNGLEDAHAGVGEALTFDEALLLRPQHGIQRVRILRVHQDLVGAGVFVLVEHLLERAAAVGGAEHATLGVGTIRVAERSHEHAVGIDRVHRDRCNHLRVAQPEMQPRLALVRGLVEAVANCQVGADDAGARADVDDLGIRRRDGNGANRPGALAIEQRHPVGAVVGGAPDAAVVEAGVEGVGLAGHARDRARTPGARRANVSPPHLAER